MLCCFARHSQVDIQYLRLSLNWDWAADSSVEIWRDYLGIDQRHSINHIAEFICTRNLLLQLSLFHLQKVFFGLWYVNVFVLGLVTGMEHTAGSRDSGSRQRAFGWKWNPCRLPSCKGQICYLAEIYIVSLYWLNLEGSQNNIKHFKLLFP